MCILMCDAVRFQTRKKLTASQYEKMVIVHEENAPFPPAEEQGQ